MDLTAGGKFAFVLGSQSPRRKQLFAHIVPDFRTISPNIDESFPANMPVEEVAEYLSLQKAQSLLPQLASNEILVCSDTTVIWGKALLEKPADREEAIEMLLKLNGQVHEVRTGVCIAHNHQMNVFSDSTLVTFNSMSEMEIEYYVDHFSPYDKAGSYGAQDWWGMTAILRLEGSYFNVMGLPIHKVYAYLKDFIAEQYNETI